MSNDAVLDGRPSDEDFATKLETAVINEVGAHVTRMIDERAELNKKIYALHSFVQDSPVFVGLDATDQRLLVTQMYTMRAYDTLLELRIGRSQDAGK